MLLTPAQIKPKLFDEMELFFFFFTRGGYASCLQACLGARLLPQSYQYPNLSEGADRVGGQLRGDKECPFSGVTKSGRVWRKVLECGANTGIAMSTCVCVCPSVQALSKRQLLNCSTFGTQLLVYCFIFI